MGWQQPPDGRDIINNIPIRRILKDMHQILEWNKAALFSGFNQAENNGAGFRTARGIGEQEILSVNDKGLN